VISIVDDTSLGRALGAVDYLLKPVDGPTLLAALSRLTFTSKVKEGEIRVLIVDDDASVREHLSSVLSEGGFAVRVAAGGAEAIAVAADNQPDLVLLDLLMPDVSGFEVAAALKSNPATAAIPILVLTAKDLSPADKQRLNGYVEAIVAKDSVVGEELVAWLGRVVEKARPAGDQT
jgi:CheY-like chemotaxis protein